MAFSGQNSAGAAVPLPLEMDAYEKLGPKVREVIRNAPIKVLAATIYYEFTEHHLDPFNHELDRMAAQNLRLFIYRNMIEQVGAQAANDGMKILRKRRK